MLSFSIDLAADRIVDIRTRGYFTEVSRSFATDCYRSSLVMLWTVVVCDLVYKLQDLRDLYGDAGAGKLLEDVEKKRAANPNSPDWEIYLLDEIATRTKMLDVAEHVQLQHLQKLRHLSAHPVLTNADLLFRPTKEVARAQIRIALEAVLLKPALFTKRIVETLLDDIAANKAVLIKRETLKAYLEARYLPNMPEQIERELFRALWKLCFRLNNADAQANRAVVFDTIAILYSRDPAAVRGMIDADRANFSIVGPEAEPLDVLIEFLSDHGEIAPSLDPAAHILIDARLAANINSRARARFKTVDMAAHLASLLAQPSAELAKLDDDAWLQLLRDAEAEGVIDDAVRIAIRIYGGSGTFDAADRRFSRFIEPALPKFTLATMTELLGRIETAPQTYNRGRSAHDHGEINDAAVSLGVDTTAYQMFTACL